MTHAHLAALVLFAACAQHAAPRRDYGSPLDLRVCLIRDVAVTDDDAQRAAWALRSEFVRYGLLVDPAWVREDQRPAAADLIADLETVAAPLLGECDRVLAVVSPPDASGGVTAADALIGYAGAEPAAVRRQFYRMLDCRGDSESECGARIVEFKRNGLGGYPW